MGLKITTQIGTDKGITSEAYVRISDYQISKTGWAFLGLQLFLSKEQATAFAPGMMGFTDAIARNQEIGERFTIPLTKEIEETVIEKQIVPVEITEDVTYPGPIDENGNSTTTTVTNTRTELQEQDVEVIKKTTVVDMSPVHGVDVFEFGYTKLKAKLVELYGADKVVDC